MTEKKQTLGFIGAGNMATALIGGLVQNGYPPSAILVSDPHLEKCEALHESFGISIAKSNQQLIDNADVIVLAIKPQMMTDCLKALNVSGTKLWISVATGIPFATYAQLLGEQQPVIRVMPNTPALVGQGASAMVANAMVTAEQRTFSETLLQTVSTTVWCDEETDLNMVTGISGSGPAYFFYVMEALIEEAVAQGLPLKTAQQLVIQTAFGAASMAQADPDVSTLKKRVAAKGGTTAAALDTFEKKGMAKALKAGAQAAIARAKVLANPGEAS